MDILIKQGKELYPEVIDILTTEKQYSVDKLSFKELDEWRNSELPTVLATRYENEKETWLTKDELVKLMDWKLMKGKFRPTLPKLIKSNDATLVEEITKEGFAIFLTKNENYELNLRKSLNKLCELRGVGPATSTLMVSLLDLIDTESIIPPFFSDESFLWFNPDYEKLKYTFKEYFEFYLKKYMTISKSKDFNKIEKATWAIYKQSELNPEFKIDPSFLKNYNTYKAKTITNL